MKTTLSTQQIITEWLDNSDVLPITKQSYRNKTGLWLRWLLGRNVPPQDARRVHVLEYKHHLENNGHTQLTVDSYITAVKLFYRYCESARYCENIAAGIRSTAHYKGHRKQSLTAEQAARLLSSIETDSVIGKRDKLIVALMLYNGLRTCEVQRIDICDFDIRDNIHLLTIQRKGRREKAETIAVRPVVMDLFEDYTACRNFDVTDPLFVSTGGRKIGERLTRGNISETVKARLRSIGVDSQDVTAHSLRHTYGTLLIEQGVDVETVKDSLGHTSTTTTRIYVEEAQRRKLIKNNPSIHIENALKKAQNIADKQTKAECT